MQATQSEFERQLRSLFAMLRTLVRQTVNGHDSVQDYAAHLEGRIGCLARVHGMLLRAPEDGIDLHELICAELLTQAVREHRYQIDGPEVRIARLSAVAITLAFHELTMNSLTHGALANQRGTVKIVWHISTDEGTQTLHVHWREHDAGLVNPSPRHKGFGSELIERMLPYELNARPHVEYTSDGAQIELQVPERAAATTWHAMARH